MEILDNLYMIHDKSFVKKMTIDIIFNLIPLT
jgi:hypothetical protein